MESIKYEMGDWILIIEEFASDSDNYLALAKAFFEGISEGCPGVEKIKMSIQ